MRKTIIACLISVIAVLTASAQVPYLTLNNGQKMPQLGIGTYGQTNDQAYAGVLYALQHGYRHIDTAHAYYDEEGVGRAIKESGVPREEIWVTSKLWISDYSDGKTMEHIDEMLSRLQLDYVDLLYVHQPMGDVQAAWKVMEEAVKAGKVRTLGISNFERQEGLIEQFATQMELRPAIIQIESHPYRQALEVVALCSQYDIAVEDWFPLGGTMSNGALFEDPVIKDIAAAHGKTPAQVIIRWHLQEGRSVIPGSKTPSHIDENFNVFDFALSSADMARIRGINKEDPFFKMGPPPANFIRH